METIFRFFTILAWALSALFVLTLVLALNEKPKIDINNERFFELLIGLFACISWIAARGC